MNEFACDVRSGLGKRQKELPSKYLYDELGSALFDAITVLPEYGLTRADDRVLQRHAGEIPKEFSLVAELGSGSGRKTRAVLEPLGGVELVVQNFVWTFNVLEPLVATRIAKVKHIETDAALRDSGGSGETVEQLPTMNAPDE